MAYEFLERCNKKKLKARGDYGVRVARPGFDANYCADNQLIFNSGWPILQLCSVIDFSKVTETYTRYLLPNGTWADSLPSGYDDIGPDDSANIGEVGINKTYCRKLVSSEMYMDRNTWDMAYGQTYKKISHRLGFTPFFIQSELVSGVSGKVLLFNVDIETDVDYPYTDEALPLITAPNDYGMKSSSIFGPRVPGLSTGQFSKLVQAIKTQETAVYTDEETNTKVPFWSPLNSVPTQNISKAPILPFEAFGFVILGDLVNDGVVYDDKDGGYYTSMPPTDMADGGSELAYAYSLAGQSPMYKKKSSLVILRSPLVSPEFEEVTV